MYGSLHDSSRVAEGAVEHAAAAEVVTPHQRIRIHVGFAAVTDGRRDRW